MEKLFTLDDIEKMYNKELILPENAPKRMARTHTNSPQVQAILEDESYWTKEPTEEEIASLKKLIDSIKIDNK